MLYENSKWSGSLKLLEENIGKILEYIGSTFLNRTSIAQEMREN
jgi:hypothetical protein